MDQIQLFSLDEVSLTEGILADAQYADERYILSLDPDRLLAPFLIDAGFDPVKPGYGNWEGSGLNGHIGGHYLSALAMMYSATGHDTLKIRLDYMIDWLQRCQQANGDGYVGGIPNGKRIWDQIRNDTINAASFSLNGGWVPLYNIHKTFAGLRDAFLFTRNKNALSVWTNLSDWWLNLAKELSDDQLQQMLKSEHGGMSEVFADLYAVTGHDIYLNAARRLIHQKLLDPLVMKQDSLTGLHANTQIPKVVGMKRTGELAGDENLRSAAEFFWQTVVDKRTISIGGNSVREHFNPTNDFSSMLESEQGPETCNTYNMLRLTKELFVSQGDSRYIDFYERVTFNHILSSQNPGGGFVYFTPIRPNHYRVYSQSQQAMWCCVGSGLENHAKYGELIYARKGRDILVNLFVSSVLAWKEESIRLVQETNFPYEPSTTIRLEEIGSGKFDLQIRVPSWAHNHIQVTVNGKPENVATNESGYAVITKDWSKGDIVRVEFEMSLSTERLPDKSNWFSFLYGPIVLAARADTTGLVGLWANDSRMGHVANGPKIPLIDCPTLIAKPDSTVLDISKVAGKGLRFFINPQLFDKSDSVYLVPFFEIHEARYILYWPIKSQDNQ